MTNDEMKDGNDKKKDGNDKKTAKVIKNAEITVYKISYMFF